MGLKTIHIVRHGFRLNWHTQVWKSPTGLPRDPPLSSYGDEQAAELAAYFASLPEDERPTAIWSSPYYRCLQTANPVANALDLPIWVEHGLTEWYSPVRNGTGLHPGPVSAEKLVSFFQRIDPSYAPTFLVTRKGESVQELYKRGEDFLNAFIQRIQGGAPKHERILLVTHAATIVALSQALLGDESVGRALRVGCCTLSTFDRVQGTEEGVLLGVGAWQARGTLASAAFLPNGVERDWGMADIEVRNGVVVEDDGVPGTEGEEDVIPGVQRWMIKERELSRL